MDNSRKEFERYLKGEMSDEERHLFEKDMLDNPFEYEAMEGLEEFDTKHIIEDLESLDKLISEKQKNEIKPRLLIYRAAAVILLLATFGILTYYFSKIDSKEDLLSENIQTEENSGTSINRNTLSPVVPEKEEEKEIEDIEPVESKSTDALTQTRSQPKPPQTEKVVNNEDELIAAVEEEPTDDVSEEIGTIENLPDSESAGARVQAEELAEISEVEAAPKAFSSSRAKKSVAAMSDESTVALENTIKSSYSISFPDGIEENKLQPKDIKSFNKDFNENYTGPTLPENLEIKLFSNGTGAIVRLKSIIEIDKEILSELERVLVLNKNWKPTVLDGAAVSDSVRVIIK